MASATATSHAPSPMSKRNVFTSITPLPPHISRAAIVAFLHDYEAMMDVNPLIIDRSRIPPPADAEPDEVNCVWYQLTDAVVMPWSSEPSPVELPTRLSNSGSNPKQGNVSYTCVFNRLPDGLQTHCRAPLGVDIRDRWTVGGTQLGEPRQPIELGLEALGAPVSGLYLREDVDLRCNRLMAGFVKKTLKKSHTALITKISNDLSTKAMVEPSTEQPQRENVSHDSGGGVGAGIQPYRPHMPGQRPEHSFIQASVAYKAHRQSYEQPQAPYQSFRSLPRPQQHQPHQELPYRSYQELRSRSDLYHTTAPLHDIKVPAILTVGQQPPQVYKQSQQNTQLQRPLQPYHSQSRNDSSNNHISINLSSLSSSPSLSMVSTSTPKSSRPSSVSSSVLPHDLAQMTASPLTRLQIQVPKINTTNLSSSTSANGLGSFAERQRMHAPYEGLMPPSTFNANQVAAELRRHSTGNNNSDSTMDNRNGCNSNHATHNHVEAAAGLPLHDQGLCPQPLRVGRWSYSTFAEQQHKPMPAQQAQTVQQTLNVSAVQKIREAPEIPESRQQPAQSAQPTQPAVVSEFSELDPYEYDSDDYEDDMSPVNALEKRDREMGLSSPTMRVKPEPKPVAPSDKEAGLRSRRASDWQRWRKYLTVDME